MVSVEKALAAGFKKVGHRISKDGKQMMLNEQELRKVNAESIASAAIQLGGRVVNEKTAVQRVRQINQRAFITE